MQQANGQIMLFHLSGPMSFSSAKALVRSHAAVVDYQVMMLDLTMLQKQHVLQYIHADNIYINRIDALKHAQQLLNK